MKLENIDNFFLSNKHLLQDYIFKIKKKVRWNIYSIINPTLVNNPYASNLPFNFFLRYLSKKNKFLLTLRNIFYFYIKNFYLLISYFVIFMLYKIFFKKKNNKSPEIIFDIFSLVDKVNIEKKFNDNYLPGLYKVFEKYNKKYSILIRPYSTNKNPFNFISFFKTLNEDERDLIFEYDFFNFFDFIRLFFMILKYPLSLFYLIQSEKNDLDRIFNISLIQDLRYFSLVGFTRFILGEKLSKVKTIRKIYSWSEFQVIERGFNYGIRKNCNHIEIIGLQLWLVYSTHFHAYVDDIDYTMLSSPHKILVNGKYYLLNRHKVTYALGVSLRYNKLFQFNRVINPRNIILLGSYKERETKFMIKIVKDFSNVIFKNHPAVDLKKLGKFSDNIKLSNLDLYQLFLYSKLVITTASGTALEAVACGIPTIIVARKDTLTANPLTKKGKGKIWEIIYDEEQIFETYKSLTDFNINNYKENLEIAKWYKNNFFINPTEKNIIGVFGL